MNVILVYPRFPVTYWGFQYSLRLIGKRASLPPLGLITVAALLPNQWNLRLVDLNVQDLRDDDLQWAGRFALQVRDTAPKGLESGPPPDKTSPFAHRLFAPAVHRPATGEQPRLAEGRS